MPRKSKTALERDRFQVKIKTQYPGQQGSLLDSKDL